MQALLNGHRTTEVLHACAALGIPDLLADQDLSAATIAQRIGANRDALERLLHALVHLDILCVATDGRHRLTSLGERLRSEAPGGWHAWALLVGTPAIRASWAHLVAAVRTGTPAFTCAHGTDIWAHRERHPGDGALFDRAMRSGSARLADAVSRALDDLPWERVVDVGGGDGTLLAHLLRRRVGATGIVVERPRPAEQARALLRREGLEGRADVMDTDFFEGVPAGADLYLLKFVLHDWPDEQAVALLRNCRRAATRPDVRVVIIERLLGESDAGPETALSDLNMLVNTGGRERARHQYDRLLLRVGLEPARVRLLSGALWCIEAVPRIPTAAEGDRD